METYTLAPLPLCLKGFPSSLLRLSKYVAELWVFTAGSSPLYQTKLPPIDNQVRPGTEGLSEKENVRVICYKIYFKLAQVLRRHDRTISKQVTISKSGETGFNSRQRQIMSSAQKSQRL